MAERSSTPRAARDDAAAAGRRTFWPTVLLGAAGAGLAAYAGHRHWIKPGHTDPFAAAQTGQQVGLDSPASTALALVALAAWGVVLVTRGWVRRVVALLGALAALVPIPGIWATRHHLLDSNADSHATAWPWVALAGFLISWLMAVVAVRKAPQWPEMGSRYDAPTGAAAHAPTAQQPLEEQSSIDLWKSLDKGHDPTRDPTRDHD